MAVYRYDEDEYLFENDENGAALETFMREQVEVVGIVREAGGRQIITVRGMQPRQDIMNQKRTETGEAVFSAPRPFILPIFTTTLILLSLCHER